MNHDPKRPRRQDALEFFASMMLAQGAKLTPCNKAAAKALEAAKKKQAHAKEKPGRRR